jgi:uncharacterized membrane protein (DUF373 family)
VDKADHQARKADPAPQARSVVARSFTLVEDVVYVGLGVLLAVGAVILLGSTGYSLWQEASQGDDLVGSVVKLLDRLLLVLMIVEVLYTVQLSFREHAILPEPFLVIGLVASIRRILVLTAEFSSTPQNKSAEMLRLSIVELGLLTLMVVALVASLIMLRRYAAAAAAPRDT